MGQVVYRGIVAVCIGSIVFQLYRQRLKGIMTILYRMTAGLVGILCANSILGIFGFLGVGMNPLTISVLGSLGMPGVILLYILLNLQYM